MDIECSICKGVLCKPGALVFSPPQQEGNVIKLHVCLWCWGKLYAWMLDNAIVGLPPKKDL